MHALAVDTADIARELHALLRDLDPARWTRRVAVARAAELETRLTALKYSLDRLFSRWEGAPDRDEGALPGLLAPLRELHQVATHPPAITPDRRGRARWLAFRHHLMEIYRRLALALEGWDIHVPGLRPTNYWRNAVHAGNAAVAIASVELLIPAVALPWVAVAFAGWAWSMEIGRRHSPWVNRQLMRVFGLIAHPHEHHRVNSATWFCTALVVLATLFPMPAGAAALAILGFGDPAAALVGRRFGRTQLINGRSLEGSAAFVATGTLMAGALLQVAHPEIAHPWWAAGLAATLGAVAELVSRRVDDNLSIPVAAAFGAAFFC